MASSAGWACNDLSLLLLLQINTKTFIASLYFLGTGGVLHKSELKVEA